MIESASKINTQLADAVARYKQVADANRALKGAQEAPEPSVTPRDVNVVPGLTPSTAAPRR